MKITVRKKEPEVKQAFIKNVPVGHVFEVDGVTALKLTREKVALFTFPSGSDWFEIMTPDSCWSDMPVKILGKLTEIILEK